MMKKRDRLEAARGMAWAMRQEAKAGMLARLMRDDSDGDDRRELECTPILVSSPAAAPAAKVSGVRAVKGAVAVIQIRGVIVQHGADAWMGDTATERVARAIDDMQANPNVGAIVLDVDSPGGVVFGVRELSEKILASRDGAKPIYSIANSEAASAAYWIASAASKFFVTPSGQVGSIGVWSMHIDASKAMEDMGYAVTLVSAGKYKVEGHPFGPLEEEARAHMQEEVDAYYDQFAAGVAAARGVKASAVRSGFGEGRMLMAEPARVEGMVDGVATLPELLAALIRPGTGRGGNMADAEIALAEVD
jgi:capsid assembly protease